MVCQGPKLINWACYHRDPSAGRPGFCASQNSLGRFRLVCHFSWQPWIGFERLAPQRSFGHGRCRRKLRISITECIALLPGYHRSQRRRTGAIWTCLQYHYLQDHYLVFARQQAQRCQTPSPREPVSGRARAVRLRRVPPTNMVIRWSSAPSSVHRGAYTNLRWRNVTILYCASARKYICLRSHTGWNLTLEPSRPTNIRIFMTWHGSNEERRKDVYLQRDTTWHKISLVKNWNQGVVARSTMRHQGGDTSPGQTVDDWKC